MAEKTQKELIEHFTKQLEKCNESHGVGSHYSAFAFYQLQGITIGMSIQASNDFAQAEMDRLKEITLKNT